MKLQSLAYIAPVVPCAMASALVAYMPPGPWPRMGACLYGLILIIGAAFFRKSVRLATMLAALAFGMCLGAVCHGRAEAATVPCCKGFSNATVIRYEGRLTRDPRRTGRGLLAYEVSLTTAVSIDGARATASGIVGVFVRPESAPSIGVDTLVHEATRGQMITFRIPHGFVSPQSGKGAWTDALAHNAAFVSRSDVNALGSAPAIELLRSRARTTVLKALRKAGGQSGPLLEALVIGVRDELDGGLADDFRNAGCAHILALSGQHVGILAGLASLVLGLALGPFRARAGACILAGLFLYIVGPSPSVARAVFMFWIKSALTAADRPQSPLAVLCISFVIALIVWPQSVHSISFCLSYLAVAGIVILEPSYEFCLRRWLPPPLSGAMAMGFAALVATAPLSILTFGSLNLFSPLTSALAGILVTFFIWAGLASAIVVSLIPSSAILCSQVCCLPYTALARLMGIAASAPRLTSSSVLLALIVALAGTLVYAWPHVSYLVESRHRAAACKLRLSQRAIGPPREPWTGHAQEVRPEFPHKRPFSSSYSRPLRLRPRVQGMGNRARHRINDT